MRFALLVVVSALLLATAASGGPSGALAFTGSFVQIDNPIEQQQPEWPCSPWPECVPLENWIVNPTACQWDVDDHEDFLVSDRYLAAGTVAEMRDCLIADWLGPDYWPRHGLFVDVYAASSSLTVVLSFAPGPSLTLTPVASGNRWRYCGALEGPWYQRDDPVLQPILGSNGGVGVITDVAVTVSNPTARKVGKIDAQINSGSTHVLGVC